MQRNQPNSMSKRKAKYDRSDRATYHKTGRKNAARKAAEARWNRSQTTTEALTDVTNITVQLGSRIMDLENLGSGLAEISSHSGQCGGMCVLDGEVMHAGLASILSVKCLKCGTKFQINSSKRVKTADGHQRWVVNVAAVLGQMATGGGATSLTCSVTPMNVPGMPKKLYSTTERFLSDCMHQLLTEKMIEAGEEERRLAVERADMHQGMSILAVGSAGVCYEFSTWECESS